MKNNKSQTINQIKQYVQKFDSDEALLRSGGIPIEMLDRAAHGFSESEIKTISPKILKIRWHDDLENVKWEIKQSKLSDIEWAVKIDLSEPIDVDYWEDKEQGFKKGFYIQDGHHRYTAAKILGKPLNCNLEIKINPIKELTDLGYDDFHRQIWKQSNNSKLTEVDLISETQDGQVDLEKFANDILKAIGERVVRERDRLQWLDPENPELKYLPLLFTGTMKGEGFTEISDFVRETSIRISLTSLISGRKETEGLMSYGSPKENNGKEIIEIQLKYSDKNLAEINKLFVNDDNVSGGDVYFVIFYMFFSTLLHELQHAYDAWRSKGKGLEKSKGYDFRRMVAKQIASSAPFDELTPEDIESVESSHKEYQNLVSEINARYAQAMHETRMYQMNNEHKRVMKSWEDVLSEFKINFDGWKDLNDKMRKRLTQRVSKAFQETSDKIKNSLQEKIKRIVSESVGKTEDVWYHGTPDARALEKEGGFEQRYISVSYLSDPEAREQIQLKMNSAREEGNDDEYFRLLDISGEMMKQKQVKSPVFLTNNHRVARTYADPRRSSDYQNAEEKVVQVKVNPKNNLKIVATGDRFRFIGVDKVKKGFLSSGVSEEDFDAAVRSFNFYVRDKSGIKTDMIAAIAQGFGFDSIDIVGVLDSRDGGSVKSTVRMVFDPSDIQLQNNSPQNQSNLNESRSGAIRDYYFSTSEWDYRVEVYENQNNTDFPYFGFKAKSKDESDFSYDMAVVTNDDIYKVIKKVGDILKDDQNKNGVTGYSISSLNNKKGDQRFNFYIKQLTNSGWEISQDPSGYPNHVIIKEGYDDVGIDYVLNKVPKIDTFPSEWEKRSFTDFTLLYEPYDDREGSYGIIGKIRAFDNQDGTEIGNVSFMPREGDGKLVGSIDVRSDWRRKKVGTEMYKFVEEIMDDKLIPDTPHTDKASKFWGQPNREFGQLGEDMYANLNKVRFPKISSKEVFSHDNGYDSGVFNREIASTASEILDSNTFSQQPVRKVNVKDIVPTQRFLNFNNLEAAQKNAQKETGAYLIFYKNLYFVIDGHHRIANKILLGDNFIEAHVFVAD